MIAVPQSTVEKPLTPIDYIAAMEACATVREVGQFADQVPSAVRNDERFTRAVAARLGAIKEKRKRA